MTSGMWNGLVLQDVFLSTDDGCSWSQLKYQDGMVWYLHVVEFSSKLVSCGPGPDEDDDDNGFVQITMAEG